MYDLKIRGVYDFAMRAPALLGNEYRNATVLSILDYEDAVAVEDVAPIHAQVYTELPPGTPVNPKDLIYVKILTSTGQKRALAMDWFAAPPQLVVATTAEVKIFGITLGDLPALRRALVMNGFNNIEIKTNSVPAAPAP